MPRIARNVVVGLPHHITQKGNYGQQVFFNKSDYKRYLLWIKHYQREYGVSILAFCLMPNHVHFIAIPHRLNSFARFFSVAHMRYAKYKHEPIGKKGHLWQARFYSCALSEKHLYRAIRYVERNPVKADLIDNAWEWPWSSSIEHLNQGKSIPALSNISYYLHINCWKSYLTEEDDEKFISAIQLHTRTGKPLPLHV